MRVGTDGVLLGAWAELAGANTALDIGTGSGLIGLMLAQRAAQVQVDALDIDAVSCAQAAENVADSPFADRIQIIHASIQDYAKKCEHTYDLIVSNPPFFTGGALSHDATRNQVRQTVKLPHGDLLHAVRDLLAPAGRFCVILPLIEGMRFREMAANYRLFTHRVVQVRDQPAAAVKRLLLELSLTKGSSTESELILKTEVNGGRTREHQALVADFYL